MMRSEIVHECTWMCIHNVSVTSELMQHGCNFVRSSIFVDEKAEQQIFLDASYDAVLYSQ